MQAGDLAARAANKAAAAATKAATGETSQFYAVSWIERDRKWQGKVWRGGSCHHICHYDDEVAAARAVDEWLSANGERPVNLDADGKPLERLSTYASIYRGVTKAKGKWQARIKVGGKFESPGTYVTQKEAALAYDMRARELRNPRRGTNFRLDGTCNELVRGKVVTQVEDEPAG